MEVHFSSDVESKLSRLASQQGLESETLVQQAVERMVNDDEWFRAESKTGLSQVEEGRTLSHAEVGIRLGAYLASKQQRV